MLSLLIVIDHDKKIILRIIHVASIVADGIAEKIGLTISNGVTTILERIEL